MPQFVMEGRDHAARAESPFVLGFIEAMFFTECGQVPADEWNETEESERHQDGQLPCDVGYADLHPESLAAIRADCEAWQAAHADLLALAYAAHWQRAATAEGWRRVTESDRKETSAADCAKYRKGAFFHTGGTWQSLCELYGITPGEEYDETQAGRDYWFTRNGHGVGYWDRKELKCPGPNGDSIGQMLSDACRYQEVNPFFGDHVTYGNAPFVHVDL